MRQFKLRMSLRYKLLLLLTILPVASLALYLVMATNLFKKDKVAYVFDSSATVSRSLATQMRTELQGAYSSLRTIVEHYDFNQKAFSDVGQDLFTKNPKIHAIVLLKHQADGQYVKLGELAKPDPNSKAFAADATILDQLRAEAFADTLGLGTNKSISGAVNLSFRLGEKDDADHMIIMGLYQAEDMTGAFENASIYKSLVLTRSGDLRLGMIEEGEAELQAWRDVLKSKASEGTAESHMANNKDYLISYSSVGLGDLMVVSKVDKAAALKAVEVLIAKSVLFCFALTAFTLLISIFASNQLTSSLRELFEATKKVGQGDFNVRVKPRSSDEVGGLAESFNTMTSEISRLVAETAEKARMQGELATVRTVQETLFPPAQAQFGSLRIRGHFEPASECGGDWWNYSRIGNKIYLWIGDATGHGAPAALITSAARSAAAVIESLPGMTPGVALSIMNRAIHLTSKGQIMMTFFLASIDLEERTLTYASASHDHPYLIHHSSERLTRKDLIPLNDVNGPRLGDNKDHQYQEFTVPFGPGDLLYLYTDGILDVESPAGKKWGERAFLKALVASAGTEAKVDSLINGINEFRLGSGLVDDVTLVVCEYLSTNKMAA